MPKLKTHKATKKRFRLSANGKAKHRQAGTSHLAGRKTHKTKRMRRQPAVVEVADTVRIQRALNDFR